MNPRALAVLSLLLAPCVGSALGQEIRPSDGPSNSAPAPVARLAPLAPCRVPGVDEEVLCGRHEVPENPAAPNGRKIALKVVVLPARSKEVLPDPWVFLAGGGVAPATSYAGYFARSFPGLRLHRDVLLVDQRGTGESNPLDCDLSTDPGSAEYRNEARFVAAVRRCRNDLETKADLRFYTTPFAMDDLDEVRAWLGYPRLNLYGVSYGTQAARIFLLRHPDRVRTLALQGVLPLDVPVWLEIPRSTDRTLARVFAACAAQPACRRDFPYPARELDSLLLRLAEKPARVEVSDPEGGRTAVVTIDAEVLRAYLFSTLYSAEKIRALPLTIHRAVQGDFLVLARWLAFRGKGEIPKGVYLSIVCSEEIPRFESSAVPAATAGTALGDFRLRRELLACREWPHGGLPEGDRKIGSSQVPALILSGALDHVTPPRYAVRVARSFPKGRALVLPNRGHDDTDPCVASILEAFVSAGSVTGLDAGCLDKSEDLRFALRSENLP